MNASEHIFASRQIVEECRAQFADSFMKPKFYRGESIQMEIMEAGLDCEDDKIYCRLSADGYLDCTDLHGPFETVKEACDCLIENYGNDS